MRIRIKTNQALCLGADVQIDDKFHDTVMMIKPFHTRLVSYHGPKAVMTAHERCASCKLFMHVVSPA